MWFVDDEISTAEAQFLQEVSEQAVTQRGKDSLCGKRQNKRSIRASGDNSGGVRADCDTGRGVRVKHDTWGAAARLVRTL